MEGAGVVGADGAVVDGEGDLEAGDVVLAHGARGVALDGVQDPPLDERGVDGAEDVGDFAVQGWRGWRMWGGL